MSIKKIKLKEDESELILTVELNDIGEVEIKCITMKFLKLLGNCFGEYRKK